MDIKIRNGSILSLDTNRWLISDNPTCQILSQDENYIEIQNNNNLRTKIPQSIIHDNHLQIIDGKVVLSKSVYKYWVVDPERKMSKERLAELFRQNGELIFRNKEVVLKRAEYYLLRPDMLLSGAAYSGGFSYSLGALIESMNSGQHFFFEEFGGFKKMYLISTSGSPLSGGHTSIFWCAEENRLIQFRTGEGPGLPKPFLDSYRRFTEMVNPGSQLSIDFEDQAIEQLIKELKK